MKPYGNCEITYGKCIGLYLGSIWALYGNCQIIGFPRHDSFQAPPRPPPGRFEAPPRPPRGPLRAPSAASEAFPGDPAGVQVDASGLQLAAEVQRLPDARGGRMPCPPPREACLEWASTPFEIKRKFLFAPRAPQSQCWCLSLRGFGACVKNAHFC